MTTTRNIIDTGLVEFELPFDRGTEKIYFNPNDVDFYIRITDMVESLSGLYDDLASKYEKETDNEKKLNVMRELNTSVKDLFDVAFGNKVSDGIFKYVSPHGIVAGDQYYAFYIIEYLLPLIAEITGKTSEAAVSALEKAVNKHATKYQYKYKK